MKQIYETYSAEETAQLGRQLGKAARPSEVYALIGELGVGKTALSKGIAAPRLRLCRFMRAGGCRFTILTYIA